MPSTAGAIASPPGVFNLTAGAVSAVLSITAWGSAPGLDQTGDYGDPTVRTGVDGAGWVAEVRVPDLGAIPFDPTKFSLQVLRPTEGGAGSTLTTVTGVIVLRRQWANAAQRMNAASAGVRQVFIKLSDPIFAADIIVSASVAAGYYGGLAAGSITTKINASDLAYPKPLFVWLQAQYDRQTADFRVEGAAFSPFARGGQQVARVEYQAFDASGHASAVVTSTTPELSTNQTQGNIAECYAATIPLAALTQGDACTVNARVIPIWGDAASILDLSIDGVAQPTTQPQTVLQFCCDKTGGYGGAQVAVQNGAVGGAVQATYALAVTTPFPSINAALAALPAYNLANKGHNDLSGADVWLMEDAPGAGATLIQLGSSAAVAVGKCWARIRVDPAATGVVQIGTSGVVANRNFADLLWWDGVRIKPTNQVCIDSGQTADVRRVKLTGVPLDWSVSTSNTQCVRRFGRSYGLNVSGAGRTLANQWLLSGDGTNRVGWALALGWIDRDATVNVQSRNYTTVGCQFSRVSLADASDFTITDSHDGNVIYNNMFFNVQVAGQIGNNLTYAKGLAFEQNVWERAVAGAAVQGLSISEQAFGFLGLIMHHNTLPGTDGGSRFNQLYCDNAGTGPPLKKGGASAYNAFYAWNSKGDTFTTTSATTGRVANWNELYGGGPVARRGDVVVNGASDGSVAPDPGSGADNWLGMYWPPDCSTFAGAIGFVNNQSGTAGAGNGDYHLTGGANPCYDRVAAGLSVFLRDISGVLRRTDGTGAAGAYERP